MSNRSIGSSVRPAKRADGDPTSLPQSGNHPFILCATAQPAAAPKNAIRAAAGRLVLPQPRARLIRWEDLETGRMSKGEASREGNELGLSVSCIIHCPAPRSDQLCQAQTCSSYGHPSSFLVSRNWLRQAEGPKPIGGGKAETGKEKRAMASFNPPRGQARLSQ